VKQYNYNNNIYY